MRNFDFTPLWRSTIGFDRIFDLLDETQQTVEEHYPPYNIERLGEDHIGSRLRSPASTRTRSQSRPSRTC